MTEDSSESVTDQDLQEKILKRIYALEQIYNSLAKKWKGTLLNKAILRHLVESYFEDLGRVKSFHPVVFANQYKRASYSIKWISKLRPIQLANDDKKITRASIMINEIFAIHAGCSHLDITVSDMSAQYLSGFIYNLHFRNVSARKLISEMYLLERAMNKELP